MDLKMKYEVEGFCVAGRRLNPVIFLVLLRVLNNSFTWIMISEQTLQEFKEIWRNEVGTQISEKEAVEQSIALLTMFDAVYRPIKKMKMYTRKC